MGLINREDAIAAVHDNYDGLLDFTTDGKTIAYSLEEILSGLPAADQMGWTPTSVKPPKDFEYVLVQLSWGGYELKQYIPPRIKPKYKDGYWGESDGVDYDYFEVVAWRSLPEPYKEGEK